MNMTVLADAADCPLEKNYSIIVHNLSPCPPCRGAAAARCRTGVPTWTVRWRWTGRWCIAPHCWSLRTAPPTAPVRWGSSRSSLLRNRAHLRTISRIFNCTNWVCFGIAHHRFIYTAEQNNYCSQSSTWMPLNFLMVLMQTDSIKMFSFPVQALYQSS